MSRARKRAAHRKTYGTRSKYESAIYDALKDRGVAVTYESMQLTYEETVRNGKCPDCGSDHVVRVGKYTPDFVVTRTNGTTLIIEAKGYFKSEDRSKMKAVLKHNPGLDIRMMFMQDGKISGNNRYSDWCMKNGIDFHIGKEVPERWLSSSANKPASS